ncbi:hypothetical protein [Parasphingorhabdus sp.]|uniref:hypothetical protein n=1 Tax=Parasphingorhabdus sp. TaxID=2709688 RepID=UPI003A91D2EC
MQADAPHQQHVKRAPGALIGDQIAALVGSLGLVTLQRERAWASITFSGTRYSFLIEWSGNCEANVMHNLVQSLPDQEFVVPRYFVADILVRDRSESRILLDVLAIVDPVEHHKGQGQR